LPKKLALIHTSPSLSPLFQALCADWMPSVEVFHMVDESLIRNTVNAGHLQKTTIRRVISMVESARLGGADAVLVTCSSIGAAVDTAAELFDFPVIRVDEAMAEEAVKMGGRVGVLATLRTTLEPTRELVRSKANGHGVKIVDRICDGAFMAVMAGNGVMHDTIVSAELRKLMQEVDVVVLAQASMARVLTTMPPESLIVPVLSSPELGVRRMADVMKGLA
jgi:Asp/Glu/hydantoin racemase